MKTRMLISCIIIVIVASALMFNVSFAINNTATNISKAEYVKKFLTLKNIRVDYGYGQFDVPGVSNSKKSVFGTIKNAGDKTINLLEITVYFLDKNKKRIGEKDAIIINTGSIFDKSAPLKPNYSKDFGIIVADIVSAEWTGKVEIEIKRIDGEGFTKIPQPTQVKSLTNTSQSAQINSINPFINLLPVMLIIFLFIIIRRGSNNKKANIVTEAKKTQETRKICPKCKSVFDNSWKMCLHCKEELTNILATDVPVDTKKIKETKCTCSACGNVWYYGKQELLENRAKSIENCGSAMSNTGSDMMCCSGCAPAILIPKQQAVKVKDLNKCPKCNSSAIRKEEITHEI